MKPIAIISFLLLACIEVFSHADSASKYNISFKKGNKNDTLRRSKDKEVLWSIEIMASDNKGDSIKNNINTIELSVDENKSTLPSDQYDIISNLNGKKLEELSSSNPVRVVIKKESDAFNQIKSLKLVLKIKIKKPKGSNGVAVDDDPKNNQGELKEIELTVMPAKEPFVTTYKYLGYLGTNFDLVEGKPKVKNLFFATNIFIPEKKHWGFSLGLYGNRSFTRTDTSREVSFQSRIARLNDTTIVRSFDSASQVTNRVSDNIGAYFMPLIPLKFLGDEGPLEVYYAPQFEFIWRKTTLENSYLDNKTVRTDTSRNNLPANTAFPLITPLNTKIEFNVYDAYFGLLGLLFRYENQDISVRLSSSVGLNLDYVPIGSLSQTNYPSGVSPVYPTYDKQVRWFFFARLWITEPTTGLTLGAEVSNYFGYRDVHGTKVSRAQPYYNVTLSKAFDLKNLATVVKPLSSR